MQDVFFSPTKKVLNNITMTFDTVWSIAVGLWNLRCSVNGIKHEFPDVTQKELINKFNLGSGIHGVNYKRTFEQRTWEEQQMDFGWILLNNTFALFEGWLEELNNTVFPDMDIKKLQFPNKICDEIERLKRDRSSIMENSFYNTYKLKRDRNFGNIEALLHCYRIFKEARNCYMHNGRLADKKLVEAYNEYKPFAGCDYLGVKEVPEFDEPVLDEPIKISLRGVVGFSYIIIKIIVTLDTELICTKNAETEFINRYKSTHKVKSLKTNIDGANRQIEQYVRQCGFCTPQSVEELKQLLLKEHLVSR